MTVSVNNRTFIAVSNLVMIRDRDKTVLNLPSPTTFQLNTGIEQIQQTSKDGLGREVLARNYIRAVKPTLSITYAHINPELIQFSFGQEFASGTATTRYPRLLQVTKANYTAAAAGFFGNGIVADPALAYASVTVGDFSTALTREAYTGTGALTGTKKFAIGANGALQFSQDLVDAQEVISLSVPYSITGANKLSDIILGSHSLTAAMVDTENKVTIFEAYSIKPNLSNSQIDFGSGNLAINFDLFSPPGSCSAYSVVATGLKVNCEG